MMEIDVPANGGYEWKAPAKQSILDNNGGLGGWATQYAWTGDQTVQINGLDENPRQIDKIEVVFTRV